MTFDHSSCRKKTPLVQKTKYSVGDWVYFEYKLNQITRMDGDHIREVSDGFSNLSSGGNGLADRCMPLDMDVKRISYSFDAYEERIREEALSDLNYPDINNKMVEMWVDICDCRSDKKVVADKFEVVGEFVEEIIRKCKEIRRMEVGGASEIRLIRRQ